MRIYTSLIFNLFIIIIFLSIRGLNAEQIAVSWEFNDENNSDGWEILFGASDLIVSNGTLQATASSWYPSFQSSEFDIPAKEYGIISLRMKVVASTSARFVWETDGGDTGFISFPLNSDTSFYEYRIPVYDLEKWGGQIIKFKKLEIKKK